MWVKHVLLVNSKVDILYIKIYIENKASLKYSYIIYPIFAHAMWPSEWVLKHGH